MIAKSAIETYNSAIYDTHFRQNVLPHLNGDPLSDLALIGSLSLLQLARAGQSRRYRKNEGSPLYSVDIQYVFQAILWLDSYLTTWPKNEPLRMLLVKLYLLIGCVSRAKVLWDQFDIKNAILDSMISLFFDRISTIAPGLFVQGSSHVRNPMDAFHYFYRNAVRRTIQQETIEALQNQNWQSIFLIYGYGNNLKQSCALVMTVVEGRRGERLKTGKNMDSIDDDPLVCNINLGHTLKDNTDYSYLPDYGSTGSVPTEVIVSHGPKPSNTRAHLSLLAERFIDLVSYVQPKDLKPSRPGQVFQLDRKYAMETSVNIECEIQQAFTGGEENLTSPEIYYYRLILKLAKLTTDLLTYYNNITNNNTNSTNNTNNTNSDPASPPPDDRAILESSVNDVLAVLQEQAADFLEIPANYRSKLRAFHGFVALHAMGMLRESALAAKLTASCLTATLDKAKTLENTNKTARASSSSTTTSTTAWATWATGQLRSLTTEATAAERQIEQRVRALRDLVQDGGWVERLHGWTFAEATPFSHRAFESGELEKDKEFRESVAKTLHDAIGGDAAFEAWAGRVVESWKDLVAGWCAVKFG